MKSVSFVRLLSENLVNFYETTKERSLTLTSFGVGFILYLVVRVYQSLRKQMEELDPTLFVALNINPRIWDSAQIN